MKLTCQRLIFPFCFLLSLLQHINAQPNFALHQFTTSNGLPSSETYEIIQDREGYIWIGTDNGVSRFNGYEFRNFGALDGLTDPVVFYLQVDRQGRIWMQSLSGNIFYFEKDSIHAFSGNKFIHERRNSHLGVNAMYIDSSGNVYSSLSFDGLYRFSPEGKEESISNTENLSFLIYQIEKHAVQVITRNKDFRTSQGIKDKSKVAQDYTLGLKLKEGSFNYEIKAWAENSNFDAFFLNDGTLLVEFSDILLMSRNGKLIQQMPYHENIISWFENKNGVIYLGLEGANGVRVYSSIDDIFSGHYQTILEGSSVSHILEDRDGGMWFATLENGIFYSQNPSMEIYGTHSGFPANYVTSIAIINENQWLVGFRHDGSILIDIETGDITTLKPKGNKTFDLVYDPVNGIPWISTLDLACLTEGGWREIIDPNSKRKSPLQAKKLRASVANRSLWGTNTFGFFKINLDNHHIEVDSRDVIIDSAQYISRTLDVFTASDGRTWVANVLGLFELRGNKIYSPSQNHPAFNIRVEAIDELPDGTLVIGSKGLGAVFWKKDKIASLTTKEGLTTNMIENLHVDKNGILWAGTLNGLNRIKWDWEKFHIDPITTSHGLPSDEITQVKTLGNYVYVATTAGLARFSSLFRNKNVPKPILEGLWVNNEAMKMDGPLVFPSENNDFLIRYLSLQFQNPGKVHYRYRLKQNENWNITLQRQIYLVALPPGKYIFEVQAQNPDGLWSKSEILPFTVLFPWYQTWWFYSLLVAAFMALVFGIFMYFKTRFATQRQLLELERKALQAQMNPHFIFNCLNSIQRLMIEKDTENAVAYLNRFAKLVRGTLKASVAGEVTLEDEIQLLTNYLELEKLRFKEKFDYSISKDASINVFNIAFPPMLLQPYVENALIHGIEKIDAKGKIGLSFKMEGENLMAIITDNGPGLNDLPNKSNGNLPKAPHQSVGMMLTQKRLELLNASSNKKLVQIANITDEKNRIHGTSVTVKIKLNDT